METLAVNTFIYNLLYQSTSGMIDFYNLLAPQGHALPYGVFNVTSANDINGVAGERAGVDLVVFVKVVGTENNLVTLDQVMGTIDTTFIDADQEVIPATASSPEYLVHGLIRVQPLPPIIEVLESGVALITYGAYWHTIVSRN